MGKVATDAMIDGGLDKVASCVNMTICSGEPANFAAIAAQALATVSISSGVIKANGDASGRKAIVPAKTGMSITATGLADHVVIDDGVSEYEVTTCTGQTLTSGGTVSTNAWDIEISDPT